MVWHFTIGEVMADEQFYTRIRSRQNNKRASRNERSQMKSEITVSEQTYKRKHAGIYKIKNICGIEGIGLEPKAPEHRDGFWFIAHLPSENAKPEEIWVRADMTEKQIREVGLVEENWVDRLFRVDAISSKPGDLTNGVAYLMDDRGTANVPGIVEGQLPNLLENTVPPCVAALCGPFGFDLKNLDGILEKLT